MIPLNSLFFSPPKTKLCLKPGGNALSPIEKGAPSWSSNMAMTSHHVGLPALHVDAAIDAPPEIVFRFSFPSEDGESWHREGGGNHSVIL